ncbi:hypothetical protein BBBOND_0313760 [Babesia bigemina]|uniref:Uncharacterized protein n=1 Tax=Babesia bigemina TaxID=5866 RepID=A0A061DDJ2_BABBI|nr:hypothetical protein BBBOND_0313760 [Babesia bigemina]CDR97474.1 hypothetical protein BBBOND_0313760 [Babesia bigemina]|eukprot:XP_012769660.1 hypothetical protein BBBOND_0313760 [Babesia bigemina]
MVENKYKEFVDKAVRNFHEAIERRTISINKRGKIRFTDESAVNRYTELELQISCDKPLQQLLQTVKENATLEKDFVSRLTYFYNSLYLFRGTSRTLIESTRMSCCENACVRSNRGVKHIGANSKWKVTEAFNSTATKIQEHYATVKESGFESGNNCIEDKSGESNATMVVEL